MRYNRIQRNTVQLKTMQYNATQYSQTSMRGHPLLGCFWQWDLLPCLLDELEIMIVTIINGIFILIFYHLITYSHKTFESGVAQCRREIVPRRGLQIVM